MSRMAFALVVVGTVVTLGCSQNRSAYDGYVEPEDEALPMAEAVPTSQPVVCSVSRGPTPWLLFDRIPQGFEAGTFAFRSDWPSAAGRYEGGEITHYREWTTDYFGHDRGGGDFGRLHRRFQTYRVGTQYR